MWWCVGTDGWDGHWSGECRLVGVLKLKQARARANAVVSEVAVIPRGHPPTCHVLFGRARRPRSAIEAGARRVSAATSTMSSRKRPASQLASSPETNQQQRRQYPRIVEPSLRRRVLAGLLLRARRKRMPS